MSDKNEKVKNEEKLKDENELEDEEEEKNLEKFKINYLSFPTSFPNTKLKYYVQYVLKFQTSI